MKNIKECFEGMNDITPYLKGETRVDEGLKDVFNAVKNKFKQAWQYLKGVVVKFGTYFLGVDDKGEVVPAITPLTAGQAYVDGSINKASTFVYMDKAGSKITGCKTKLKDAIKLKGSGNSIAYWNSLIKESVDENGNLINEVKLHTEDPEAKYNIIVDDDELKEEIKFTIKNKGLARLMIWGAPGIGKTAILMKVLEELEDNFSDYNLIVKTLSNETPDNFTLPKYIEVDGQDFATDVPKTWLPVYKPTGNPALDKLRSEKCGKGLLFIDELSRATPQVLNVMLPLVNEGMFNGYKLGDDWTIICASNRAEDEMDGQSKIGNALANRFSQIYYEPTVHTWRKWADKQGFISPLLLQWLSMPESEEMSGGKFYYMDPNEDSGRLSDTTIMCTPRSWTNAMEKLALRHHTGSLEGFNIFDIPKRIIARDLNECVPAQAVDAFLAFLAVVEKIGNFDNAVYEVWQNGGKGLKIDKKHLTKVALPLSQLVICAHSKSLPTKEEWENLVTWLVDQKSDQLASYTLDIFLNVFMGMIGERSRNQVFTIQQRIKKNNGDTSQLTPFIKAFEPFCTKWNVSFDEIPDYYEGLTRLIKAYGASFKSAVIDAHTDALG